MSSDNGIYIAKFPEGYRVAYAMAIDNVFYYETGTTERKNELKAYFGNKKVFNTSEDAWKEAHRLYDEYWKDETENGWGIPLEYGVSYLGEFEGFE